MPVLRADPDREVTWVYGTDRVRLGVARTPDGAERRYRRTLDADEIQYQVSGRRTLATQRGIVELEPGDFVRIPLGISHASTGAEAGEYVSLLSHRELPQMAETTRTAEPYTSGRLETLDVEVRS